MGLKSFKTTSGQLVRGDRSHPVTLRLVIDHELGDDHDWHPARLHNYFVFGPTPPNGKYVLRFKFDRTLQERPVEIKNGMIFFLGNAA